MAHQVGGQPGGHAVACATCRLPASLRIARVPPSRVATKKEKKREELTLAGAIHRKGSELGMLANRGTQRFIDDFNASPDMDGVENLNHIA